MKAKKIKNSKTDMEGRPGTSCGRIVPMSDLQARCNIHVLFESSPSEVVLCQQGDSNQRDRKQLDNTVSRHELGNKAIEWSRNVWSPLLRGLGR